MLQHECRTIAFLDEVAFCNEEMLYELVMNRIIYHKRSQEVEFWNAGLQPSCGFVVTFKYFVTLLF